MSILNLRLLRGAACCLLTASIAGSAMADDKSDDGIAQIFHGAPKFKNDNGDYWKVRGRLMWDIATLSETPTSGIERSIDDSEFRAARIGAEGKYGDFKFTVEADFAGSKTSYKDVNIAWSGPVKIKVGQMKAGGSMEEMTSGRHTTFIERGMITDGIGFDRRIGAQVSKSFEAGGLSAGIFGNSINGAKDGKPTNTIITGRGYYVPIKDKANILHFGASVRHTDRALGAPSHSARWGSHLATEKIKPNVGDDALLFGLEAARIQGSFHAEAEFLSEEGDLGDVQGGFIQAGYFLTGETRKYKGGKMDRTKPKKPVSKGGYGAWELAARFDTMDARGAGDEKVDAYTLGVNWHPESHARISVNYTTANGDRFDADGLYMRLQMDW